MNEKLDEILYKLNLIETRLDILETAMFGLDDEDKVIDLADVENEDDEEITQHNEIM